MNLMYRYVDRSSLLEKMSQLAREELLHFEQVVRILRDRNIDCVNVMGLATQFSVEHTVRDAADLGFHVRVFADCCASADMEAHHCTLRTLVMLADVVKSSGFLA